MSATIIDAKYAFMSNEKLVVDYNKKLDVHVTDSSRTTEEYLRDEEELDDMLDEMIDRGLVRSEFGL